MCETVQSNIEHHAVSLRQLRIFYSGLYPQCLHYQRQQLRSIMNSHHGPKTKNSWLNY